MTLDAELSEREHRLARHYLNKLRSVNEAMRRGQANVMYGLAIFDQEWEQIRHWQAWTAQREPEDKPRARLCIEFPLMGLEILANRNNADDQIIWLRAGLDAAQQLQDLQAERTLCYELMMVYYRLGSLDLGKQIAGQLLSLGEAAKDLLCIERAWFGMAVYSEERGMYSEAEQSYQQALRLSSELGEVAEIGRALNALGGVAQYVGDFEKSYHYFLEYLELMEVHRRQNKVCHALLSIGESLISLKAYAEAERQLQRGIHMCRTLGYQRLLGVGLLSLSALAIEQNELETAKEYLHEGLQAVRAVGVQRQIIAGLTKLGYIDLRRQDFAGAFAHLQEGLNMARNVGNPRYICDAALVLAHTYLAVNDLGGARKALHESLSIVLGLDSRAQKARILSGIVAYYHCLGHYKQAAIWAGTALSEPLIDDQLFKGIRAQLEATLGGDIYRTSLETGSRQSLDDSAAEALTALAI